MVDTGGVSGGLFRQVHRLFCLGTVGDLTDGELLDRFVNMGAEDSEAAFEELMHRHGPMVLRVCRGMLCDPLSAEDAFQATFLVLAQRAGSIRRRDSVSSWLFGVARRVAAHSRLCTARRRSGERQVAEQTPEAQVVDETNDDRQALLEEMGHLPDPLRGVVVLCYLEGLTYEVAGQRLGLSEGAVRGRLARARDQLRRRLTRDGATLSAGFIAAGFFYGAWRSDDGGTTWEEIDEGLERDQTQPAQVVNIGALAGLAEALRKVLAKAGLVGDQAATEDVHQGDVGEFRHTAHHL